MSNHDTPAAHDAHATPPTQAEHHDAAHATHDTPAQAVTEQIRKYTSDQVLQILKNTYKIDRQTDAVKNMEVTAADRKNEKLKKLLLEEAATLDIKHDIEAKFAEPAKDKKDTPKNNPAENSADKKGAKHVIPVKSAEKPHDTAKPHDTHDTKADAHAKSHEEKPGTEAHPKKDGAHAGAAGHGGDKKHDAAHEEHDSHAHPAPYKYIPKPYRPEGKINIANLKETGKSFGSGLLQIPKSLVTIPLGILRFANTLIPWKNIGNGVKAVGNGAKSALFATLNGIEKGASWVGKKAKKLPSQIKKFWKWAWNNDDEAEEAEATNSTASHATSHTAAAAHDAHPAH